MQVTAARVVSVAATTGLFEAIAAAGADPDRVLAAAGSCRAAFTNPLGTIASSTFAKILEQAALATGDRDFGLHFGERFDPRDIGILAYVVLNSPTVAGALRNVERYMHIHNSAATVWFAMEGSSAGLMYLLCEAAGNSMRQHNEYSMSVVLKTLQSIAGRDWSPLEVRFVHDAPPDTSEHDRVFGTRVSFGCAANALSVERAFLDCPVRAADAKLFRILENQAERLLSEVPREHDVPASVRRAIIGAMAEGAPTLRSVAGKLSIHPRTLERRLAAHGLTFKALLDDMRRRLAVDYVRARRHNLTGIAFLLGYSEVSAFNRAFRRWTGSTPTAYRNRARVS